MTGPVRVRFAPSPTGLMHLGNARTALYNWLWARHVGGEFVIRIEDTDAERSTPENVAAIFDALAWLGLDYDTDPVIQTANAARHRALIDELLADGRAYRSNATKDDVDAYKELHGHDRGFRGDAEPSGAVRLRVPDEGTVTVPDLVRGDTVFELRHQDDPVIARADGSPLYNFAVAVDDADMGITHVIRGEDHLSNTPKQLLVMRALGLTAPTYAHLPLLHGPDGGKLAKRHGATSVQELAAAGFLPEAVVNYLALLGWGADDNEELLSPSELIRRFDIADVTRNPARFDQVKLTWLNGKWVRRLPVSDLAARLRTYLDRPEFDLDAAVAAAQEKFSTLDGFWPLAGPLLSDTVDYDEKSWRKVMEKDPQAAAGALRAVRDALAGVESWTAADIEAALTPLPEKLGVGAGKVYQPVRVALTGSTVSVGIFDCVALLERTEAMRRIENALNRFSA